LESTSKAVNSTSDIRVRLAYMRLLLTRISERVAAVIHEMRHRMKSTSRLRGWIGVYFACWKGREGKGHGCIHIYIYLHVANEFRCVLSRYRCYMRPKFRICTYYTGELCKDPTHLCYSYASSCTCESCRELVHDCNAATFGV